MRLVLAPFDSRLRGAGVVTTWLIAVLLVACTTSRADIGGIVARGTASTTAVRVLEHCEMVGGAATCVEYSLADEIGVRRKLCEEFKSKFLDGVCPTANRVGTCAIEAGQTTHYYDKTASKDWGYTVETAKKRCESDLVSGKFTALKK